jgi:hypothetical protein
MTREEEVFIAPLSVMLCERWSEGMEGRYSMYKCVWFRERRHNIILNSDTFGKVENIRASPSHASYHTLFSVQERGEEERRYFPVFALLCSSGFPSYVLGRRGRDARSSRVVEIRYHPRVWSRF